MRSFGDPSFFRVFDTLLGESNSNPRTRQWTSHGIDWVRERHSFTGAYCSFGIDVFRLTKPTSPKWSFVVVKEHWWGTAQDQTLRSTHWAKPISGNKAEIMKWMKLEQSRQAIRSTNSAL